MFQVLEGTFIPQESPTTQYYAVRIDFSDPSFMETLARVTRGCVTHKLAHSIDMQTHISSDLKDNSTATLEGRTIPGTITQRVCISDRDNGSYLAYVEEVPGISPRLNLQVIPSFRVAMSLPGHRLIGTSINIWTKPKGVEISQGVTGFTLPSGVPIRIVRISKLIRRVGRMGEFFNRMGDRLKYVHMRLAPSESQTPKIGFNFTFSDSGEYKHVTPFDWILTYGEDGDKTGSCILFDDTLSASLESFKQSGYTFETTVGGKNYHTLDYSAVKCAEDESAVKFKSMSGKVYGNAIGINDATEEQKND